MKRVFIGYVIRKQDNEKIPVSASSSKRLAGEAAEAWLDEQDNGGLDYKIGGVFSDSVPYYKSGSEP